MKLSKEQTFYRLVAVILVFMVAGILSRLASQQAAGQNPSQNLQSYTASVFAMDTYMTMEVWTDQEETGRAALREAEEEIRRLEGLWSTGLSDSEISRLNGAGAEGDTVKSMQVSEDTCRLLYNAIVLYKMTDGAFDVTVYPVMEAWGFYHEKTDTPHVPKDEVLADLLTRVNAGAIVVNYDANSENREVGMADGEIRMKTEAIDSSMASGQDSACTVTLSQGVSIDLGGIAKGYTSMRIMEIFKEKGITCALINLGGNVQTMGNKPDGSAWKVGIKNPLAASGQTSAADTIGVVDARDLAVVSSGGYERYFEEKGETYHHIIDPATGYPAKNGLVGVTILSSDGTLADGLSTALYVMGTEKAISFWKAHSYAFDCILVAEDGTVYVSEGAAACFTGAGETTVIRAGE